MVDKLMTHLCSSPGDKKGINLEYIEGMCKDLFEHRHSAQLEARIKFKI